MIKCNVLFPTNKFGFHIIYFREAACISDTLGEWFKLSLFGVSKYMCVMLCVVGVEVVGRNAFGR